MPFVKQNTSFIAVDSDPASSPMRNPYIPFGYKTLFPQQGLSTGERKWPEFAKLEDTKLGR
ncbi:MAG TPA: hypothetical protein DCY79_14570 [Planctomycetaceae bacterium]|nr:hypothetical protein [Blastopirellula sp.]MAR09325.1 hypothetical protein [Blastopirellula sp.]HAY81026.1 hypothetical protein [Planctomycetaceae bacterium]